jgi:CRP-like cAMP-binding protein
LAHAPADKDDLADLLVSLGTDLELDVPRATRTADNHDTHTLTDEAADGRAALTSRRALPDAPADATLRAELRARRDVWTLVDIGTRHQTLGDPAASRASHLVAAGVFAHRGLLIEAITAVRLAGDVLSLEEQALALGEVARLRVHERERLNAYMERVDTHGFWPLLQDADPDGFGMEHTEGTAVQHIGVLFGDFDEADFVRVALGAELSLMKPGDVILRQGDRGDALYAIGRGRAIVHCAHSENPDERVYLSALVDGDLFGEFALLTRRPRAATVEASTELVLLHVERDQLEAFSRSAPRFQEVLVTFYKRRMAELVLAQNPRLALLPPEERVLVLERSESMVFHDGARIEVPVRTLDDGTIDEPCLFVLAGEVAVNGAAPHTLTPGHFVDDVTGDPARVLYAVGDVHLLRIAKADLQDIERPEPPRTIEVAADAITMPPGTAPVFSGV